MTDHTFKLWDVTGRRVLTTVALPNENAIDLSFSPDGHSVLLAVEHGVLTWRPGDTAFAPFAPQAFGDAATTYRVAQFDPTGDRVVIGTGVGARVVDAHTQQVIADRLAPTGGWVNVAAWSSDGRLLAIGTMLGIVEIWDTRAWQPIGVISGFKSYVYPLRFSPDSTLLLAGDTSDLATSVWPMNPTVWMTAACRLVGRNLSHDEWRQYVGGLPYQPVCPDLPIPADSTLPASSRVGTPVASPGASPIAPRSTAP
jgi:WD40 repeat protein